MTPPQSLNPRPVGLWRVTHSVGGGGVSAPCDLPNYWTDFQNQTPFDSLVRELSKQGVKFDLEVTDDLTGQVS